MKIIKPGYEILSPINREEILKSLEIAGRTCYKSEDKITEDSASKFVRMLINRGHEAMIEHVSLTVKFVCDRGITHEIVRHRIASYAQESTRYCNYSNDKFGKEITVIKPLFYNTNNQEEVKKFNAWSSACEFAEQKYFELIKLGSTPQEARSVLPNSLKTEIVVTMREVAVPLFEELKEKLPEIFDSVEVN